jgi:hypothetical protein
LAELGTTSNRVSNPSNTQRQAAASSRLVVAVDPRLRLNLIASCAQYGESYAQRGQLYQVYQLSDLRCSSVSGFFQLCLSFSSDY